MLCDFEWVHLLFYHVLASVIKCSVLCVFYNVLCVFYNVLCVFDNVLCVFYNVFVCIL